LLINKLKLRISNLNINSELSLKQQIKF